MIELFKRYSKINDDISDCLMGEFYTEYITTEFVVSEPKHCVPKTCKIYDTEYAWRYDQIKKQNEIERNKNETWKPVRLCELWYDNGDDGHTDYRLFGWVFITDDFIKDVEQSIKGDIEKYGRCYGCFSSKLSSKLYDREQIFHEKD